MKKAHMSFQASETKICTLVTKFGGQPVWLEEPSWPLDDWDDEPMTFMCQIVLTEDLFPGLGGKVLYVFNRDNSEDESDISDPSEGVTAVIVQAGSRPDGLSYLREQTGPSLSRHEDGESFPVEFSVELTLVDEPECSVDDRVKDMSYEDGFAFGPVSAQFTGNKVGGQAMFPQPDSVPDEYQDWTLVLQLAPTSGYYTSSYGRNFVPFFAEWGDGGLFYVLMSPEGDQAVILTQTY